jgi:lipopolysaccharide-induced tumor necrosis factor-alpha factor
MNNTETPPYSQPHSVLPDTMDYQKQPELQVQQMGVPPQQAVNQRYKTTIPIAILGRSGAPVDCPSCGNREMTRTNFKAGNSTQYVVSILTDIA